MTGSFCQLKELKLYMYNNPGKVNQSLRGEPMTTALGRDRQHKLLRSEGAVTPGLGSLEKASWRVGNLR